MNVALAASASLYPKIYPENNEANSKVTNPRITKVSITKPVGLSGAGIEMIGSLGSGVSLGLGSSVAPPMSTCLVGVVVVVAVELTLTVTVGGLAVTVLVGPGIATSCVTVFVGPATGTLIVWVVRGPCTCIVTVACGSGT